MTALLGLVCSCKLTSVFAGTGGAFVYAFFYPECLSEHSQQVAAQAYLAYLTDALRFDSVVSTALAMFFTVALLQLGGIPDPYIGEAIQAHKTIRPQHDSLCHFSFSRREPKRLGFRHVVNVDVLCCWAVLKYSGLSSLRDRRAF